MEWVKISEAAALSKRPARTIRHNALIGKFRAKKEGKDWYVDLNSLRENGWLPKDGSTLPAPSASENSNENTSRTVESPASNKKNALNKKSARDVRSLGVYAELLGFCRSQEFNKIQFENIGEFMVKALVNLSIGYFEFDFKSKIAAYRSARQNLLHSLAHLHIKETEEHSDIKTAMEVIGKILPGIGGLVRRTEKRMYERRPRSEGPLQD
jgi:hypothetical protein